MRCLLTVMAILATAIVSQPIAAAPALKALIIDGQNNHDWRATTPILKKHLEDTGLFTVDVATSPPKGSNMSGFAPAFKDYNVVVSIYNGDSWSDDTK